MTWPKIEEVGVPFLSGANKVRSSVLEEEEEA